MAERKIAHLNLRPPSESLTIEAACTTRSNRYIPRVESWRRLPLSRGCILYALIGDMQIMRDTRYRVRIESE
jgi:hypothetical protein